MPPIRTYTNWNTRSSDTEPAIEPYRKHYFICEGKNTETWYFRKLIDLRKTLGIRPLIDISLLEKTEEDADISYPQKLIEFADLQKENPELAFDKERDKMVVVFDADIFEDKVTNYDEVVAVGEQKNILAVTNPGFELFLLLHYNGAYDEDILPHAAEIIRNEKTGNQRFIYSLLLKRTDMNSKRNPKIGELAVHVKTAIEQERKVNQDIHDCRRKITSNIGLIIDNIIHDEGDNYEGVKSVRK